MSDARGVQELVVLNLKLLELSLVGELSDYAKYVCFFSVNGVSRNCGD